jgi:hypothetical protein
MGQLTKKNNHQTGHKRWSHHQHLRTKEATINVISCILSLGQEVRNGIEVREGDAQGSPVKAMNCLHSMVSFDSVAAAP